MTALRKRTIEYMTLKGYSPFTHRSYLQHLKHFALHFNSCPTRLDLAHVGQYLNYLSSDRGLSKSTINAAYSAIKLLFVNVLGRPWDHVQLPRPMRAKTLPEVLSTGEVQRLFDQLGNRKHLAMFMLAYGSGLRVGELTRLKVSDIDSSRMLVRVCQGKGNKDRYTILSQKSLDELRRYWQLYRPWDWLFTGQDPVGHITIRTAQKVYAMAKGRAGIHKRGGPHQLRHTFATHLIEDGVGVSRVKILLGHTSLRTTSRYLHLSKENFSGITHPMDR